ncbi:MAG: hypothetical protein K8823_241 [Cenarchaeum symbiont of Oopsacas minuta]|nr:hypothetical protein [Cenarchaeum symbiont of Oopsacas minuta]
MLDKNHANGNDVYEMALKAGLHTVICQEPFLKSSFVIKVLKTSKIPVFYIDFDLMYSGCIKGRMVEKPNNVQIYRSNFLNYMDAIKTVIVELTKRKCLVVLDSLNGFFSMHRGNDSCRSINAYVSLLAFAAKSTNSSVMVICMATHIEKKWILSPALGRIMHDGSKICLRRKGVNTIADVLDRFDTKTRSTVY